MKDSDYYFRKRMEDIPRPIITGDANLTEEELKKSEEDLRRLMMESGVLTEHK